MCCEWQIKALSEAPDNRDKNIALSHSIFSPVKIGLINHMKFSKLRHLEHNSL